MSSRDFSPANAKTDRVLVLMDFKNNAITTIKYQFNNNGGKFVHIGWRYPIWIVDIILPEVNFLIYNSDLLQTFVRRSRK